ncbi:hypothetical protein SHIRM173S_03792 [Streptomyces hirsutus]
MPDAGMFAAADQITVAGHDLALVLEDEKEVAEALRLVEEAQNAPGCKDTPGAWKGRAERFGRKGQAERSEGRDDAVRQGL